jgi:predicted homoserine dehydrogenase-like protein
VSLYRSRLLERQQTLGHPVRVGVVGAGQMGRGLITQISRMPGIEVSVVVARSPRRAVAAYAAAGMSDVASFDAQAHPSASELAKLVADGRPVVLCDLELLGELPLDMVIEATGVPNTGARVALTALLAGQDVGLLNVECDVTVGYLLARLADQLGRIYTVCRGDEPVEAKRLVDYARELDFEVIAAGKGKNNPLNPHATPDLLAAEAAAKNMNPKMLCEFVDGSKAMIEMAALANGTGLELSKRGMHAPHTDVEGLAKVYRPIADGGILDRVGVIDYCTGPVAPGVFVVVRVEDETLHEELTYLKLGDGPYFTLYRPYHLASVEAPLSIGEAILDRTASLAPVAWKAQVFGAAKAKIAVGEKIDGLGGNMVYGMAESTAAPDAATFVPLGLLPGAMVRRSIGVDELITWADVDIDETSTIAILARLQTKLLAGEISEQELPAAVAKALP